MAGMKAARPDLRLVRRVITRAPGLGGEDYDAVSPEAFAKAVEDGAFCVRWTAHGLSYAIPVSVLRDIEGGQDCMANFSRSVLCKAAALFPRLKVLNITADPLMLARRLSGRGRETTAEIHARLAQAEKPLPDDLDVVTIINDGLLEDAVAQALGALYPDIV